MAVRVFYLLNDARQTSLSGGSTKTAAEWWSFVQAAGPGRTLLAFEEADSLTARPYTDQLWYDRVAEALEAGNIVGGGWHEKLSHLQHWAHLTGVQQRNIDPPEHPRSTALPDAAAAADTSETVVIAPRKPRTVIVQDWLARMGEDERARLSDAAHDATTSLCKGM